MAIAPPVRTIIDDEFAMMVTPVEAAITVLARRISVPVEIPAEAVTFCIVTL